MFSKMGWFYFKASFLDPSLFNEVSGRQKREGREEVMFLIKVMCLVPVRFFLISGRRRFPSTMI